MNNCIVILILLSVLMSLFFSFQHNTVKEFSKNGIENGDQQKVLDEEIKEEVLKKNHFKESNVPDTNYSDNFQEPQAKRAKN